MSRTVFDPAEPGGRMRRWRVGWFGTVLIAAYLIVAVVMLMTQAVFPPSTQRFERGLSQSECFEGYPDAERLDWGPVEPLFDRETLPPWLVARYEETDPGVFLPSTLCTITWAGASNYEPILNWVVFGAVLVVGWWLMVRPGSPVRRFFRWRRSRSLEKYRKVRHAERDDWFYGWVRFVTEDLALLFLIFLAGAVAGFFSSRTDLGGVLDDVLDFVATLLTIFPAMLWFTVTRGLPISISREIKHLKDEILEELELAGHQIEAAEGVLACARCGGDYYRWGSIMTADEAVERGIASVRWPCPGQRPIDVAATT